MTPAAEKYLSIFQRDKLLSSRSAFLVLKALNLVVITAYSFELVYVLVRMLSIDIYPLAVLISSIGVYIMATDLGYSGFVYYRTRQRFLSGAKPHGSESEVFNLYMAIAIVAAVAVAISMAFLPNIPNIVRIGLSLYFFSIVLALPWGLIRRIAAAVDLYVSFELFELIRRLFFFVTAGSMLLGLPLIAFAIICLGAWVIAFVTAVRMLRKKRGMELIRSSSSAVLKHLKENYRNVMQSGSLTITEFLLYNFPYIAIPIFFKDKTLIIAFDIFYKVIRFGSVSYGVAAESFLPSQTRAFYANDRASVMRYYRSIMLLGLLPLGVSLVVLFGFGDRLFTTLLSRGGVIDSSLRVSMATMLVAVLFQSSAGTFLLGTGNYRRLSHLALITLSLMALLVGVALTSHMPFSKFMFLYVSVYCVHAVFYTSYLMNFVRSMDHRFPLPQHGGA